MKEVLKEPSSEDGDGALGEASLRAPDGLVIKESGTVVVNRSLRIRVWWLLLLLVELELVGYGIF